ncbi:MAG: hypothetical protein V8R46_07305 [Eubacterium ramulus]
MLFLRIRSGCMSGLQDLARAIGVADAQMGDIAAAEQFLKAIEHICEVCEVPNVREVLGIPGDKEMLDAAIPKMAQDALDSGSRVREIHGRRRPLRIVRRFIRRRMPGQKFKSDAC